MFAMIMLVPWLLRNAGAVRQRERVVVDVIVHQG
jgi:hypothetical protein